VEEDDSASERGFGCAGNAFGYTSLQNRVGPDAKNAAADAGNPNLYAAIDEGNAAVKDTGRYAEVGGESNVSN